MCVGVAYTVKIMGTKSPEVVDDVEYKSVLRKATRAPASTFKKMEPLPRIANKPVAQNYEYTDVNWILKLGMPEGRLREACYFTNSIECMVNAARKGIGIISSYEEFSIIKSSNLTKRTEKVEASNKERNLKKEVKINLPAGDFLFDV